MGGTIRPRSDRRSFSLFGLFSRLNDVYMHLQNNVARNRCFSGPKTARLPDRFLSELVRAKKARTCGNGTEEFAREQIWEKKGSLIIIKFFEYCVKITKISKIRS